MNNVAFTIDNLGHVGGTSGLPGDTAHHAFLWKNGAMTDLGTLPGDVDSGVLGISKGRVVGISVDASENSRAFLWENGVIFDLNTLISTGPPLFLLQASAINARGEIVGFAVQTTTGDIHAFLAIPIYPSKDVAAELANRVDTSSKMVLSENARRLLRQLPRLGRFGSGSITP